MVMLVRIEDGAEILAKKPGPRRSRRSPGATTAKLAFGTEDGEAGIVDLGEAAAYCDTTRI